MELLLLITSSAEIINKFQSGLSDGYIILTADNLKKGAELLQSEQIAVMAVDMTIPGKTATWFEQHKASSDTLLLGIIPFDIHDEDMDRYNAIFDDIIYTPLSLPRLKSALKKIKKDIIYRIKSVS